MGHSRHSFIAASGIRVTLLHQAALPMEQAQVFFDGTCSKPRLQLSAARGPLN